MDTIVNRIPVALEDNQPIWLGVDYLRNCPVVERKSLQDLPP